MRVDPPDSVDEERCDMAITAVLTQRRAGLPRLGEAAGPQCSRDGRPKGAVSRYHRPSGDVAARYRTPEQRQDSQQFRAGRHAAGLAQRLCRRNGTHAAQRERGDGLPAPRHRLRDHRRMEVVEGRCDRAGADGSEGRRPAGEVARPESLQSRLTERSATTGIEVGDGVEGFDGDPEVAGAGPVGRLGQRVTWRTPVGEVSGWRSPPFSNGSMSMRTGTGSGSISTRSSSGRGADGTVEYSPWAERLTITARLRLPMPCTPCISRHIW